MIIDFSDILTKQKELDKNIFAKHNKTYHETFNERKLALLVELGELSNEVRSFKYWSLKDRSEDEVVLEEYVDGIHFITSFCVHFGVQPIFTLKDNIPKLEKNAITIKFNKLFKTLCKFDISNKYKDNVKLIKKFYKKFLILGYGLGFNTEQILKAYDKKNTINHKRQENKY